MNNTIKYIKSFSNGQVTIPKDIRENLGIGDNFWLKVSIAEGKIIAEPLENNQNKKSYKQSLLDIKSTLDLEGQVKNNRTQVERQIANRS
jgi:AbrB family looped-hinge helix DNA binding protein